MQRVSQLKILKDTRKMPKVYFDLHVTEYMYSKISQIRGIGPIHDLF